MTINSWELSADLHIHTMAGVSTCVCAHTQTHTHIINTITFKIISTLMPLRVCTHTHVCALVCVGGEKVLESEILKLVLWGSCISHSQTFQGNSFSSRVSIHVSFAERLLSTPRKPMEQRFPVTLMDLHLDKQLKAPLTH